MRQGNFGRSWSGPQAREKAMAAAARYATQTGYKIPIFRQKRDLCDETEIYIVLFPGKAEHVLTIAPGADTTPKGDEDTPEAEAPSED